MIGQSFDLNKSHLKITFNPKYYPKEDEPEQQKEKTKNVSVSIMTDTFNNNTWFVKQVFTSSITKSAARGSVVSPFPSSLPGWAVLAGNRWQPDRSTSSLRWFFITFIKAWGKCPAASAMLISLPVESKATSSNIWTHRLVTSLCQDEEVLCAPQPNVRMSTFFL